MLDGLLQLYLNEFQQKGEPILKVICNCAVPSKVILEKYKTIAPIETMEEKEKKEMKKYVNELFPGETPQFRLNACKIVYTIGTIL